MFRKIKREEEFGFAWLNWGHTALGESFSLKYPFASGKILQGSSIKRERKTEE